MNTQTIFKKFTLVLIALAVIFGNLLIGCGPQQYSIETNIEPASSGSINIPDNGIYKEGTSVNLVAIPNQGYRFDYWSGDAEGTDNPQSITMDKPKNIIAHFKAQYILATSINPAGAGSIIPDSEIYDPDYQAILTATPAPGYRFESWSGDITGTSLVLPVTINKDLKITANFKAQYKLTCTVSPLDGGTITPENQEYDRGTQVSLIASPASGYRFDHWGGDVAGTTSFIVMFMDQQKSATAYFIKQCFLNMLVLPDGSGTVFPMNGDYDTGNVRIAASPKEGWEFDCWQDSSGSTIARTPEVEFQLTQDSYLVAKFKNKIIETDLISACNQGLVSVSAAGIDLTKISVSVTSKTSSPLNLKVETGTIFKPGLEGQQSVEDMVVTVPQSIELLAGRSKEQVLIAAGMNVYRTTPTETYSLSLASNRASGDLLALLNSTSFQKELWRTKQYAIYILLNNPSRNELPTFTDPSGGYSGMHLREIEDIKTIFQSIGKDPSKYLALQ